MKKIALVVILGLILSWIPDIFGQTKFIQTTKAAVNQDIRFDADYDGGKFQYGETRDIIEHRINTSNNKGQYIISYKKSDSPYANKVYRVYFGSQGGKSVAGDLIFYRPASMKRSDNSESGTFRGVNQVLIVLTRAWDLANMSSIQQDLPMIVGISQLENFIRDEAGLGSYFKIITGHLFNQIIAIENIEADRKTVIRRIFGSDDSYYGTYIKALSNYVQEHKSDDQYQVLTINKGGTELSSDLQQQLNQAFAGCKQVFLEKNVVSAYRTSSKLPTEISDYIDKLDLRDAKIFLDESAFIGNNITSDEDVNYYRIFYSSGRKENEVVISDAHFTKTSAQQGAFQSLDSVFSIEFGTWQNRHKAEWIDIAPLAAISLSTAVATKSKILTAMAASGSVPLTVSLRAKLTDFLSQYKEILAKQILISYYVQKHLEYHKCISDAVPDLPDEHEFSRAKLLEEQENSKIVVEKNIAANAGLIREDEGNDCGFDFGNQALEKVMCSMVKAIMSVMANFFDKSMDFLQTTLDSSSSDIQPNQTSP